MRYVAFDVETPNRYNNRMSAIGIAVVEDGRIADTFYSLVDPEQPFGRIADTFYSLVDPEQPFDWFNTQLTGIDSEAVLGAPTFDVLWPRIEPILSSGVLVAHNAPFDLGVLKKCLRGYGIEWRTEVPGLCTVRMGRRLLPGISHRLGDMCEYYGIDLDHHRADSDSLACAAILIRYMEAGADPTRYVRTYDME